MSVSYWFKSSSMTTAKVSADIGICHKRPVPGFYQVLVVFLVIASTWSCGNAARQFQDSVSAGTEAGESPAEAIGSSFVQTSGQRFVLNYKPHFVNGVNLYYLMTRGSMPESKHLVSEILKESASVGVNVVRAWAFADGETEHCLQKRPGVYDEAVFQGLDFTVSEAKKYGIRLILSFVNNYADYGGRPQYASWAQRFAGKRNAKADDFYTDETMREWYRNHVKTVLTRVSTITGEVYRDDPTIFAWELMNEPRCESDPNGYALQQWIREMAAYVKSLDSKHLLEVGLEGFYSSVVSPNSVSSQSANPASYAAEFGTDFIHNSKVDEIDFTTVHSYPDNWIPNHTEDQKRAFMGSWVRTHINDAKYKLGMPVMFAEFGKSDRTPGYSESVRITAMTDMFNAVYASARDGGPAAGALVWQFVPRDLLSSTQDGYALVLSDSPAIVSLMRMQTSRLNNLQ